MSVLSLRLRAAVIAAALGSVLLLSGSAFAGPPRCHRGSGQVVIVNPSYPRCHVRPRCYPRRHHWRGHCAPRIIVVSPRWHACR